MGTSSLVLAADVIALMVSVIVGPSRQAHARRVEPLPPTFGYSLRGPHDISSFVVIRVRKDRQEAWAER